MLSILIPTYNQLCLSLVERLHTEALSLQIPFEIVVADDLSRPECEQQNRKIGTLNHCQYVSMTHNVGPARIRNILGQKAQGDYLLFLDADTYPASPDFLQSYWSQAIPGGVVCGGFIYRRTPPEANRMLRFQYGIQVEEKTAAERQQQPYAHFIGMSFLIDRQVFQTVHFDEAMHFGYEDAQFGIRLQQQGIPIRHIDNPVFHLNLDTSAEYLAKIRRSIENLWPHRAEMGVHIRLLQWYHQIEQLHVVHFVALLFRCFRPWMEKQLTSAHPWIPLFAAYKLGYLCLITHSDQ
ncbi:MAG: glycosyltransferase family 2 protein [Parabacteroides sp.]